MAFVKTDAAGGGWHTETQAVETNALVLLERLSFPEALADWLNDCQELASDLVPYVGERHPPWGPFSDGPYDFVGLESKDIDRNDLHQLVMIHCIFKPTIWYVTHLPTLATADTKVTRKLAEETIEMLPRGPDTARQALALGELTSDSEVLEYEGNRLRSLTPLEQGEFLDSASAPPVRLAGIPSFFAPSHVLEMDCELASVGDMGQLPMPPLLTALQLHGVDCSDQEC